MSDLLTLLFDRAFEGPRPTDREYRELCAREDRLYDELDRLDSKALSSYYDAVVDRQTADAQRFFYQGMKTALELFLL